MQEIVKLYHTLPICALLSIKLHILHMIELFFQGDYFLENKLSSKGKDSLNKPEFPGKSGSTLTGGPTATP